VIWRLFGVCCHGLWGFAMAQAGVWSADKRLKNPDFSGCGAPWRESRRFQVPFLAPKKSPGSGLNAHFRGVRFFFFYRLVFIWCLFKT